MGTPPHQKLRCRLLALSGHRLVRCTCLLLTQSEHGLKPLLLINAISALVGCKFAMVGLLGSHRHPDSATVDQCQGIPGRQRIQLLL